jgi:hypothetical protein
MSVAATDFVWKKSTAEGADRLVLLALADFADESGNCFGSWGKLCEKTRLGRATVARSLKRLQGAGHLVLVEKGHRKLAGDGAEASIWNIPGVADEMGLRMRPVSNRDPSGIRMRPKWYQNETPTIRNIKERNKGADAPAPAISSPSHPSSSEASAPKPKRASSPKFDPASIPLPHGPGLARAWAEFAQHRREIKAPLTPTAAKRIIDDLGAVNEAAAVEALRKSVKHGWRGVFVDPPATAPKLVALPPQGQPRQSALERSLEEMRQKFEKENAA